MPNVPERPEGANTRPKSTATDLPRWAELGLADPPGDGSLPEKGGTADLLAFGLVLPGADDPVLGIIDAVQVELRALAGMLLEERDAGDVLLMLSNRLAVASLLLRRVDGRAPEPLEWDPDAETATSAPDDGEGER